MAIPWDIIPDWYCRRTVHKIWKTYLLTNYFFKDFPGLKSIPGLSRTSGHPVPSFWYSKLPVGGTFKFMLTSVEEGPAVYIHVKYILRVSIAHWLTAFWHKDWNTKRTQRFGKIYWWRWLQISVGVNFIFYMTFLECLKFDYYYYYYYYCIYQGHFMNFSAAHYFWVYKKSSWKLSFIAHFLCNDKMNVTFVNCWLSSL